MSRITPAAVLAAVLSAAVATVLVVSCSKSAGSKEAPKSAPGGPEVIAVPGAKGPADTMQAPGGGPAPRGNDSEFKLKPEEGQLSIEVPPDAKAGAETIAKVIVTPGPKFKINFEYPIKLTLEANPNVTIPKPELKAGGPSQVKGDAEKFEEKQLAFVVKLTPTASGNHTITGNFKFAVCDKDQCLPKREAISIQVAAK
ncbi:MAG TPA: hypothetical protein VN253_25990 [Kofleriaceae bacterium]|nr:hypothetical protein [Kofleriaceae bacterium]